MGFFFVQNYFFWTTPELYFFFFLSRKAQNIFPEYNFRLYDKKFWIRLFLFLHQNQNIFSASWKLNDPSLINFWIWLKIFRITHKIIFWCQIYLKKNNFPFQFDCCNIFCFRFMAIRTRGRSQKKILKRKCNRDKVDCCSWIL